MYIRFSRARLLEHLEINNGDVEMFTKLDIFTMRLIR